MSTREELNLFLQSADDLIEGKYILADIKIVNLLKSIAVSKTLLALFENCLRNFDYHEAKNRFLVKNKYLSDEKGEFVAPQSSRELLAFVFNVLMDVDSKRVSLGDFVNKYFYEDGSFSSAYNNFISAMIKPFKESVRIIMEGVIDGKLQDPLEALVEAEEREAKEKAEQERRDKENLELSKKAYGESVLKIKEILLADKTKIKESKKTDLEKKEIILIIDMLANVITSEDTDAIDYAFTAYKYMAKVYKFSFFGKIKKISKLLKDIYNELR